MGRWEGFGVESMTQSHEAGLDYIEVTMNTVIGKDTAGVRDRAALLKAQIDSAGLQIWSVHLPYSKKVDISSIDSTRRVNAVNYVADMIRVAAVFNPKYLVLHPSYEPIAPDERAERLENSHESIGILAPVAKEIGAVLCIENLPRTCLGRSGEEMMALIDGYDEVGLCFDINHLIYQSHADYFKAVAKGKIKTVHISDYDFADERHLVPGVGKIDWVPVWKGVRKNGYKGIMMFETPGTVEELVGAREILLGNVKLEKSNIDADSLAFCNANWQITELERGAQALYAQVPMFFSMQSISVVKYPAAQFKSEVLHRPAETAGKPSEIGKEIGAFAVLNAAYFHVKQLIPSVYFRVGENLYGTTHPTETYRVNGVVGFKDAEGKEMMIEYADTTQYDAVAGDWHTVLATGPMLVDEGELVVPLLTGDDADGDNVAAMQAEQAEQKRGVVKHRTHYSSAQFYDKRHPRAAVGKDNEGNIYYVVIDGRFKGQGDGASIYETAYICKMLGMTEAINLDGGGSSAVWAKETGVLNHPYDNKKFDHEGERVVPNLIVAY
jgi:sugar phosphate isomerase/epimerase/exopolysaccharide biosynthesis protein